MNLKLITAPSEAEILELVSVADLKENLRIVHTKEENLIRECILEAYAWLDGRYGWLNRAILTQEWELTNPGFTVRQSYSDERGMPQYRYVPTNVMEIPLSPLGEVLSVGYVTGGVSTVLPGESYTVRTSPLVGTISRAANVSWPQIDSGSDVTIRFKAGWGDAAAVKANARGIIKAIRLLASDTYRNREDTYAEPRLVAVNRKIMNGLERTAGRYRIVNNHA